jgi:hypothetical protein
MTAGLPGTGIGGLFYLVLALGMPLREIARRLSGTAGGWKLPARQIALVAAMAVVFWLEGLLLKGLVADQTEAGLAVFAGHYAPALNWTPLIMLALLLTAVRAMRLLSFSGAEPVPTRPVQQTA